jgi:hypothetical protein
MKSTAGVPHYLNFENRLTKEQADAAITFFKFLNDEFYWQTLARLWECDGLLEVSEKINLQLLRIKLLEHQNFLAKELPNNTFATLDLEKKIAIAELRHVADMALKISSKPTIRPTHNSQTELFGAAKRLTCTIYYQAAPLPATRPSPKEEVALRENYNQLFNENSQTALKLLIEALAPPTETEKPLPLPREKKEAIKNLLGEKRFYGFIKKYNLIENSFSINDLRMIIIGTLPNAHDDWITDDFIKHLMLAVKMKDNLNDLTKDELGFFFKLNAESNSLKETNQKTATEQLRANPAIKTLLRDSTKIKTAEGFLDAGLNGVASFVNFFGDFFALYRKTPRAFKRDLISAQTLADVNSWVIPSAQDDSKQLSSSSPIDKSTLEKKIAKQKEKQRFASIEFTFKKLSLIDLQEDSIIPVIGGKGKKTFYQVKPIVNELHVNCFALVPINPGKKTPAKIKVVFKSAKNIGREIVDTENLTSKTEFERHKTTILSKLNATIEQFCLDHPDTVTPSNINLTIGGHGSGGVLAQHLTETLVTKKAEDLIATNDKEEIKTIISDNIHQQHEHDVAQQNPNRSAHVDINKSTLLKNPLYQLAEQSLPSAAAPPTTSTTDALDKISNLTLANLNSGGVPFETRNSFVNSLRLTKRLAPESLNIKCNKVLVEGDPIQHAGQTDLASYIPHNLMPVTLLKISPETAGAHKETRAQLLRSMAFLVMLASVATTFFIFAAPKIIAVLAGVGVASLISGKPLSVANKLLDALGLIKSHVVQYFYGNTLASHRDCFLNHASSIKTSTYSNKPNNNSDNSLLQINKELDIKVSIYNSPALKNTRKAFYYLCKHIYLFSKNKQPSVFLKKMNDFIYDDQNTQDNSSDFEDRTKTAPFLSRNYTSQQPASSVSPEEKPLHQKHSPKPHPGTPENEEK